MNIIKVSPRGYCKGVVRAISIAKQCRERYPDQPITVLGMLVHNEYVKNALALRGIRTIEDPQRNRVQLLDEVESGVVIFTAHGISDQARAKAEQKGLICVDASCPDVVRTQELVRERLNQGDEVFYIGKKRHPEAEAVCALSEHVHLITKEQDIPACAEDAAIFVTNQTTMSVYDVRQLFEQIKARYPQAHISEEICNATRIRQQAVADLKGKHVDVLYVVGDTHSNNTKRLAQIGAQQGIPCVLLIDSIQDIEDEQLQGAEVVAVTSGASTPTYLTAQVIDYLENWENGACKPPIILQDIL